MAKRWVKISVLAELVAGDWQGEDIEIYDLADFNTAVAGQLAYIDHGRRIGEDEKTGASALIVPLGVGKLKMPVIKVDNPAWAAAVIHNHLLAVEFVATGIDQRAVVGDNCRIAEEVSISALVAIGDGVNIGRRVKISSGVVIGDDVRIGSDVIIHPNATIMKGSILGDRVIIHSNTVVGSDGFGYAHDSKGRHVKRPHVGYVQIDDDVEIGANVCIDRATFGRTWIKSGTKVDNLVQIAHNVVVGENSILVAQAGISGSTVLGNGVVMGGKAAISGHLNIGDRVTIAGKAGVINNQEEGVVVAGFPAFPHKKWLRSAAIFQKLPDLARDVRNIEKKLQEITKKLMG